MKSKLFLYVAVLVISIFPIKAVGYSADFTLYNQTGSSALIRLPGADDFVKLRRFGQLPLWQLDLSGSDGIAIKFKGKAADVLSNKTFIIKPAESATWGDLPKGRIMLRLGEQLSASLEYDDAQGDTATTELQVLRK